MQRLHRWVCVSGLLFGMMALALDKNAVVWAGGKGKDVKEEQGKLEATWQAVRFLLGGKELPDSVISKTQLTVKGDKMTLTEGEGKELFGYKLNPSTKPKQIDLIAEEGEDKGKVILGIYDFEGDTLKLCFSPPGVEKRPTEFKADEKTLTAFIVMNRVKKK